MKYFKVVYIEKKFFEVVIPAESAEKAEEKLVDEDYLDKAVEHEFCVDMEPDVESITELVEFRDVPLYKNHGGK